MGLFLQILFGANPAIKPIYKFLMVQFYKILINSLAQICKNTVNLFVKKHKEMWASALDGLWGSKGILLSDVTF
jgi:hypothetical protein